MSTLTMSRRSASGRERLPRWLQLVGVASVVVALFPYISASDDILRIENTRPRTEQQGSGPHSSTTDLLRLYETTDAPLVGRICSLAVTFIFLYLLTVPVKISVRRSIPLQSGRSPPLTQATA